MARRTDGKTKLTPEVRRRLAELAAAARALVYGEIGCAEWGTSFAEMECDAKEVGHEVIRLLLEQGSAQQSQRMPSAALKATTGEVAEVISTQDRTIETESGPVSWSEPTAYLPSARKAFFPSEPRAGTAG